MAEETGTLPLVCTKLQRPRLPGDLIPRGGLLDRLHAGSSRKLTLISAQAGAGKTALMAQWLADAECPLPSAWISLDEHDNDLVVFVSYLIGAVRTVFPGACEGTLDLLGAPQSPVLAENARPPQISVQEPRFLRVTTQHSGSRSEP
jgi:LuxR family maltose regulon positive regulatory protein